MPLKAERSARVPRRYAVWWVPMSAAMFILIGGTPTIVAQRPTTAEPSMTVQPPSTAEAAPLQQPDGPEQELPERPTQPTPQPPAPVPTPTPTPTPTPGVVYRLGDAGTAAAGETVVLTFDDGPNPRNTPQILAILARFNVHAVFCQVGSMAAANPELARAVVQAGHVVCDHTHAHLHRLATRPANVIDSEVSQGLAEITAVTGTRPKIFRSPEGSLSPTVIDTAHRYGLTVWQWSVDPKDYTRPPPQVLVSRVLDHISPGAVVLLHDGGGNRDNSVRALPAILTGLQQRGYTVTLP